MALCHRIYVGNLPFDVEAADLVTDLLPWCKPHATIITVTPFSAKHKKKRGCEHKLHPGYGYVEVSGEENVDVVIEKLRDVKSLCDRFVNLKVELSVKPRTAPAAAAIDTSSPSPCPSPSLGGGLDSDQEFQKKRQVQRQHKKRQRARSNSRRNGLLMALIAQLPAPGGPDILKSCPPLLAAGSSLPLDWPAIWRDIPQCIDPAHDFVRDVALGEDAAREERARRRAEQQMERMELSHDKLGVGSGTKLCCDDAGSTGAQLVGRASAVISDGGVNDGLTVRAVRKRKQVESFASNLAQLIPSQTPSTRKLHVVDFGCGTGNLCLALAYLFPQCKFSAVDMNARSVELLQQRAHSCDLTNVTGVTGRIEDYNEPFDVAVALHACGAATDYALVKSQACRASYIMCPCCIGKLKFGLKSSKREGGCSDLTHPRSQWLGDALRVASDLPCHGSNFSSIMLPESDHMGSCQVSSQLSPDELFAAMARAGDISHGEAHSLSTVGQNHLHAHEARLCKGHLELDRNMCMQEQGYQTTLLRLIQAELTGKSDLLVGAPSEVVAAGGMLFPWK
mmetsp:Transcript_9010/g.15249  ORF Transcript_9010/g.15249 Transcript_9010/m.15249 type:complete len:565 (-) Transcript_9010:95-1789(-)